MKPRTDILPTPQQEIWPQFAAASPPLVLYGGTAIALHLGHRVSVDFDFFSSAPLDKAKIRARFAFMKGATTLQDSENTLVVSTAMPSGPVKVSFFGGIGIGRINDPLRTDDSVMLIASLERALGAFAKMYDNDPAQPLKAIGFFNDGDLPSLPRKDRETLCAARDGVTDIPSVSLSDGLCHLDG